MEPQHQLQFSTCFSASMSLCFFIESTSYRVRMLLRISWIVYYCSIAEFQVTVVPNGFWYLGIKFFQLPLFTAFSTVMLLGSEHPVRFDGCEVYIWLLVYSMLVNPLVMLVTLYGHDPLNNRFLYHLVAFGSKMTWSFWLWGTMEYLGFVSLVSPFIIGLVLIWAYSKSTTFWLRHMRYFKNV